MPFPRRVFLLFLIFAGTGLQAQEKRATEPAAFVRANEKFGMSLLNVTHARDPDKNIALAPLPISLTFAALVDNSGSVRSNEEIVNAFQWKEAPAVSLAGRMLSARFEKPIPLFRNRKRPPGMSAELWRMVSSGKREEMWLTGAFLYRGEGSLSEGFIDRVKNDFGFKFRAVSEAAAQSKVLAGNWDPAVPMPTIREPNDFWISSFTHLRTTWAGNTFGGRGKLDFTLRSRKVEQVDSLHSETSVYRHVLTDSFEGVVLRCGLAYILLVLPAEGKDIPQFEEDLVKNSGMIDALLQSQIGDVDLPPFHFLYEGNLKGSLETLGVHGIFTEPSALYGMAPRREGGKLEGVAQKVAITVDENGIRADAGTIVHGVYGGILGVRVEPFHMRLNRPFLFFVRDNVTDALLFAGAVMDPLQH